MRGRNVKINNEVVCNAITSFIFSYLLSRPRFIYYLIVQNI